MFDDLLPKPVKQYNYTFAKGTIDIDFIEKTVKIHCNNSSEHTWENIREMCEVVSGALGDETPFTDLTDCRAILKDGWRFN
jgi:hypothetical protein